MIKEVKKVFVAMSGGVDSSVAALLLSDSDKSREARKKAGLPAGRQGYEVVGVFMRCFNLDGCAERDAEDARRVAEHLNIPFYVWDFEDEYKNKVVKYMIDGYRHGITPNPDVMCNKEIKFGLFMKKALSAGADYVATGHYMILKDGQPFIAKDTNKDQSYFLWTLTQKQLKRCLFPIGGYLKPEIRAIAKKAGLPTADKKDSQGICFLGKITLADFLKSYIPEKKGVVLNSLGEKIGEHSGAYFYTIGQRHIGVASGKRKAGSSGDPKPLYVSEKKIRSNTLVVAEGSENPVLYKKEMKLMNINLISKIPKKDTKVLARVRYRQAVSEAKLRIISDSEARLVFAKPQKFVAPGQSAVFYSSRGHMIGGGIIV